MEKLNQWKSDLTSLMTAKIQLFQSSYSLRGNQNSDLAETSLHFLSNLCLNNNFLPMCLIPHLLQNDRLK